MKIVDTRGAQHRGSRRPVRLAAGLLLGLALGLLLAEALLHLFPVDRRFVQRAVPRMTEELEVHTPVDDPRLLLSLRAGSRATYATPYHGSFTVSVNALGFRGPRRTEAKPPGVFRILCVGGSNVYGAGLNDEATWPARLEQQLKRRGDQPYEVFNLGVSGYNSMQLAAVTRRAVTRYAPDLVLVAFSNWGPRYFLKGTPHLERYYRRDPTLWLELIPPGLLSLPPWPSVTSKLGLLNASALYRLALLTGTLIRPGDRGEIPGELWRRHLSYTRDTLRWAAGRTKVAVFICPAVAPPNLFAPYYRDLGLPVLTLDAAGKPESHRLFHPPAHVMVWYAQWLEQELERLKLLR